MEKVEYYIANDGTRFEDEDNCLEYEYEQEIDTYKVSMLDCQGKYTKDFGYACYIYIPKEEESRAEYFSKLIYDMEGVKLPKESGTYYWHDYYDDWISYDELLKNKEKVEKGLS